MSKSLKWVVAALALSLAVNVFIIGVVIGKQVSGPAASQNEVAGKPPRPSMGGMNMRALGRYLSDEEKEAARRILSEHRDAFRANGRMIAVVEQEIRALISAETVDVDALYAKLAELESFKQNMHVTAQSAILGFVATLDVETRRAIAQDLFRRGPGGSRGPRGRERLRERYEGRMPPPGGRRRPPPPDGF